MKIGGAVMRPVHARGQENDACVAVVTCKFHLSAERPPSGRFDETWLVL